MRRYASYQAYSLHPNGRPDKAVTSHPAVVRRRLMRRCASYQAYSLRPDGRPDKAVTPHPA
ncbi:hypothetical protein RCL73_20680, partial [Escherichia marmotae]|nr:hypothetical protein [Escherichia marmotae]